VLFTLAETFLSVAVTFSPGLAVPEASTTSLVLPPDGGLKGAGPDVPSAPERSQGFGGEPAKCILHVNNIRIHYLSEKSRVI
jgi:hypothetical protein